MAEFRPVRSAADLPNLGDAETNVLDFKGTILGKDGKPDLCELAKDVAAFANADGGTLLFKAFEDGRRAVLGRYEPLNAEEAKLARTAYSNAVAQFCSPAPLAHIEQAIEMDKGGLVVAINVWPTTAGLIGVRTVDFPDAYFFPVRTSLQTTFLHVEQLSMFLSPEVRRKATLLRSIPSDSRVKLRLRLSSGLVQGSEFLFIVNVSESDNAVTFITRQSGSDEDKSVYPLENIRSVYKDQTGWNVIVDAWS